MTSFQAYLCFGLSATAEAVVDIETACTCRDESSTFSRLLKVNHSESNVIWAALH